MSKSLLPKAKKFIVPGKTGKHTVIVSAQDAYLLRTYVYKVITADGRYLSVRRQCGQGTEYKLLQKDIFGSYEGNLYHLNGNSLDFRRSNVVNLSRSEFAKIKHLGKKLFA